MNTALTDLNLGVGVAAHQHDEHLARTLEAVDALLVEAGLSPVAKVVAASDGSTVAETLIWACADALDARASTVEAEIEREHETELVRELIDAAPAHLKAVVKLAPTIQAIQEQRVWQLIYADGFAPPGSQCGNCKALYAGEKVTCDYCGQAVKGVSDFIDRAAERVLEMQGRVEEVRGLAAESLQEYGNIDAFLRW